MALLRADLVVGNSVEQTLRARQDAVIAEYRERLAAPARVPWADSGHEPVLMGDTWAVGGDGRFVLPEWSLGWEYIGWTGVYLRLNGEPFRPTLEQARFALHWYAVDPDSGRYVWRKGILQRLKGWGKDPLFASLALFEACGPCRPWDLGEDGFVLGFPEPEPWVQIAATSQEQTQNTMRVFPSMVTPELARDYGVVVGKEKIHIGVNGGLIEAVTNSPAAMEGKRPSLGGRNETQHWDNSNAGIEMARVMNRNATKRPNGWSRTLDITNSPRPGTDSVAEQERYAYEAVASGLAVPVGVYYDSLEAPPGAPLTPEGVEWAIPMVRGDSLWLDVESIKAEIMNLVTPPADARRFWYNQVVADEDSWVDVNKVRHLVDPEMHWAPSDPIFVFFDGSKSDDSTAIVGCRLSDGSCRQLGVWQRPPTLKATDKWVVNRAAVDLRMKEIMVSHRVVGLWGDPSPTRDDDFELYWDPLLDEWHRRWKNHLRLWAGAKTGDGAHSVRWDMRTPEHAKLFTEAAMRTATELEAGQFRIGPEKALLLHIGSAHRRPNRYGVSMGKKHREAREKVDLAVCMVGARMMRRAWQNRATGSTRGRAA